jgi:hypothetical protein
VVDEGVVGADPDQHRERVRATQVVDQLRLAACMRTGALDSARVGGSPSKGSFRTRCHGWLDSNTIGDGSGKLDSLAERPRRAPCPMASHPFLIATAAEGHTGRLAHTGGLPPDDNAAPMARESTDAPSSEYSAAVPCAPWTACTSLPLLGSCTPPGGPIARTPTREVMLTGVLQLPPESVDVTCHVSTKRRLYRSSTRPRLRSTVGPAYPPVV